MMTLVRVLRAKQYEEIVALVKAMGSVQSWKARGISLGEKTNRAAV